jgi:membrane associated rhomboid family serine protease
MTRKQNFYRVLRKIAIPRLMYFVSGGMAAVFLADFLMPELGLGSLLALNMAKVMQGEIWRLVTFVFIPTSYSLLWLFFGIYFNVLLGDGLERELGSDRFTLYYLVGMLGAIAAAWITGWGTNLYLNLSLFFAFALYYPNFEVLLFMVLPVKVKYLAVLDAVLYGWGFITGSGATRLAIVLSLINLILFFGPSGLKNLKREASYWKTRRNFRRNYRR